MFINLVQGYYSTDTIVLIAKSIKCDKEHPWHALLNERKSVWRQENTWGQNKNSWMLLSTAGELCTQRRPSQNALISSWGHHSTHFKTSRSKMKQNQTARRSQKSKARDRVGKGWPNAHRSVSSDWSSGSQPAGHGPSGAERPFHRGHIRLSVNRIFILWFKNSNKSYSYKVAMKTILWWGSPVHEELY